MKSIEVKIQVKDAGVSAVWVKRVVEKTLVLEKSKRRSVGILLTDDKETRRINRAYLRHDYTTDVISFWMEEEDLAATEKNYLGDLVVCVPMARRMSKELKIPYRQELARYLVHGTLHLLGYKDEKEKERKVMHDRQETVLRKIL